MAQAWNIVIYQGDTYELIFQLKNKGTGTPVDITGCVPKSEVRVTPSDASTVVSFTSAILGSPLDGKVRLSLTAAQTTALAPGQQMVWDVQLLWPGGVVKTYLNGTINVLPEVTRA